jgi:hypothetical protein
MILKYPFYMKWHFLLIWSQNTPKNVQKIALYYENYVYLKGSQTNTAA